MNGFVGQAEKGCTPSTPRCVPCTEARRSCIDVMGYHDAREIANYWTYAQNFVLQDNMFETAPRGACPSTCASSPAGRPTASSATSTRSTASHAHRRTARTLQAGRTDDQRVDRHHLPDVQGESQLALLHLRRLGARLRVRRSGSLHARDPGAHDTGHLEPARGVHGRQAGRADGKHPVAQQLLHGGPRKSTARCPTSVWVDPNFERLRTPQRRHPGAPGRRAGIRDDAGQLDHAQPLLGAHRDLPLLG